MKRHWIKCGLVIPMLAVLMWPQFHGKPVTTMLSFRVGQQFEEVVRNSTYPVLVRSNVPTHDDLQAGQTFVTEPAVILRFDDKAHGFTLPPTKFAMLSYRQNRVVTVATSPMLEKVPFHEAVAIMEDLQNQFKVGGWEPWAENDSTWFDLTAEGKKQLYLRLLQPGFSRETIMRVPKKYGMIFRIWCAEGCMPHRPPQLFLIDIGIGRDVYGAIFSDPKPLAETARASRAPR